MIVTIDLFSKLLFGKIRTFHILSILFFLTVGILQQIKVTGLTLSQNQFDQVISTLRCTIESVCVIVGIEEMQGENKNIKSSTAISVGLYEVSSNRERFK